MKQCPFHCYWNVFQRFKLICGGIDLLVILSLMMNIWWTFFVNVQIKQLYCYQFKIWKINHRWRHTNINNQSWKACHLRRCIIPPFHKWNQFRLFDRPLGGQCAAYISYTRRLIRINVNPLRSILQHNKSTALTLTGAPFATNQFE